MLEKWRVPQSCSGLEEASLHRTFSTHSPDSACKTRSVQQICVCLKIKGSVIPVHAAHKRVSPKSTTIEGVAETMSGAEWPALAAQPYDCVASPRHSIALTLDCPLASQHTPSTLLHEHSRISRDLPNDTDDAAVQLTSSGRRAGWTSGGGYMVRHDMRQDEKEWHSIAGLTDTRPTNLVGTWSTKSNQTLTGPGFYDPRKPSTTHQPPNNQNTPLTNPPHHSK